MIRINLLPRDEMPAKSRMTLPNVGNFAPLALILVAALGIAGAHIYQSQQITALEDVIAEEELERDRAVSLSG